MTSSNPGFIVAGGVLAGLATKPDAQSVTTAFVVGRACCRWIRKQCSTNQTVIVQDGKIVSIDRGPSRKFPPEPFASTRRASS